MQADKEYRGTAANNRGRFAEQFIRERLELVFGKQHVHSNVEIYETKGNRLGEIDVLVVFANRAIVVQSKSKRLTLEARKGNDQIIKDDFKKSVQDAYDQGRACASLLIDRRHKYVDGNGKRVSLTQPLKQIYVLCAVSDHYPALSFQARQFLKHDETEAIRPPFVLDVFTLDVVAEMLQSPLRFLSYLDRRTLYDDRLFAQQELTILAYHLRQNLWLSEEQAMIMLDESFAADLDIAMLARRDGVPGKPTPDGILTRYAGTALWHLAEDIERDADPRTIDFGFFLLTLDGEASENINKGIDRAAAMSRRDGRTHDVTLTFDDDGLTIHCTDEPSSSALAALRRHCEARKYKHRVDRWFGVCVRSTDARLRFGITLENKWTHDVAMDEVTKAMRAPAKSVAAAIKVLKTKIGRNDPCPCGSGRKHKKCCLRR